MNELTAYKINEILDRMKEQGGRAGDGCAPATIKHVLGLIKRLYNWAWENDLYNGENPTAKIKPPKFNNEKTMTLTELQTKKLLIELKNWKNRTAALVIKFALYTGCRKSEIFKLTWKDVDLRKKFMKLRDPKGKPIDLPIGQKVCDVLKEARKLNRKSKYVFANRFGKKRKHFATTWRRIKQRALLPEEFRFHDLRHTFASELISSGKVDLYRLQKLLNHQSPSMTQRYAHLADKALREAANSVDNVFD
jgi:integrase